MGIISGLFSTRQSDVDNSIRPVLLRGMPLINESDNSTDTSDTTERGLTELEESAFRRCFVMTGSKPDERIRAKIEHTDTRVSLCVRPVSIPHFRKVLADRGLAENIILAGVLKWLEHDMNRWVRFSHEQ